MSRAIDKTKVFNNVNENYSKRPNASQIDLDGPVEDQSVNVSIPTLGGGFTPKEMVCRSLRIRLRILT